MPNEQIQSYIQENLNAGVSKEDVKKNLLASGWQETDIEAAFAAWGAPTATTPMATTTPQPRSWKKNLWVSIAVVIILLGIGIVWFFLKSQTPPATIPTATTNNVASSTTTTTTTTAPAVKPTPVAATCIASDGGLDAASAIYVKGTVTSVDSTGKTQTLTDDCANAIYLEKYICYESPTGSGHYASGRTVVKCANGCVNGACKK
jgi:cytoskeletal protein RodZ